MQQSGLNEAASNDREAGGDMSTIGGGEEEGLTGLSSWVVALMMATLVSSFFLSFFFFPLFLILSFLSVDVFFFVLVNNEWKGALKGHFIFYTALLKI